MNFGVYTHFTGLGQGNDSTYGKKLMFVDHFFFISNTT